VRLAKEAQEAARAAVELDPSNDLAHHLMGRWHFEMAQINFVLRQVGGRAQTPVAKCSMQLVNLWLCAQAYKVTSAKAAACTRVVYACCSQAP
jgi:hypothetical protein